MAAGTLAPSIIQFVLDSSGNPVSGALINVYLAGTTTRTPTYWDVNLTSQQANPIVASSAGRWYAFLPLGISYKFVVTDSIGASLGSDYVRDNVTPVPLISGNADITGTAGEALTAGNVVYLSDGSGGKTAGLWYKADSTNAYSSITPEIGLVPSTITIGLSGTIRLSGYLTGLSALTVGAEYFVSTAGTMTSSAPVNRRHVGHADTASSLVITGNPPISGLSVGQGGTGAMTLTARGVLIGEGTSAVVATAVGASGQVLTGNGGSSDPTFQTLPIWKQLKTNAGTDAGAFATNLDTIDISGLGPRDSVLVLWNFYSAVSNTSNIHLYSVTDSLAITNKFGINANSALVGDVRLNQDPTSNTSIWYYNDSYETGSGGGRGGALIAIATSYQGSWTMAVRHEGVTAGGTLRWRYAAYIIPGS
jgi:hypothetical protein